MAGTTPASRARSRRTMQRMLTAVALVGAAALVAGCGIQSDPGAPPAPSRATGADPVPLAEELLADPALAKWLGEESIVVRWIEPGASLAVVLGGSGSGGECIPQPQAAEAPTNGGAIVVPFTPPNPEVACTMDFRLHGWELALAEPVDASGIVPVQLVDSTGTDDVIDLELAPDDLLQAGPTADPQPSEIPPSGDAPPPEPIPAAQLPVDSAVVLGGEEIDARWITPGSAFAVILGTSGTEACVPQPVEARATGPGTIEVAFERATGTACTDDLVVRAWRFTLPEPMGATLPVDVRVSGVSDAGPWLDATLEPGEVLELQ